jgi:serine/threonine protein kinase
MVDSLRATTSTKSKAKDGRSSVKRLLKKLSPRKSPNEPGSTDGPRSESGSGISQGYSQVDVGTDHAQFLSPELNNGQENTLRPSLSTDSERPNLRAGRSQHERQSSSISRRHVRLPSQEQAAAAEGTVRLDASQVLCTLIVAYHQPLGTDQDAARQEAARIEQMILEFEDDAAFDKLHAIATRQLVSLKGRAAEAYYLKVGRFRIVRDDTGTVAARGILERKDLWSEDLPRKIHIFRGQNYKVKFHVDIEWEYSSLHIVQIPNQTYAETIRRAIEEKIRTNWEGRFYVPRKDLSRIMTKDTISKLIHEDKSLQSAEALRLNGGKQVELNEFIENVHKWAACLLAWCIYSRLQLVCLYHMLLKSLNDKNLPLTLDNCPDDAYRSDFRNNAQNSGGFAAYKFIRNERGLVDHEKLHDGAVVPIIFDQNNPDCKLGQGSFGVVFKARIDRDHHSFSDFDDEDFALKKFTNLNADVAASVEAESDLLAKLADAPHPNITTHLASWKQGGVCYMLFRCADYNLRRYMARESSPKWTKSKLSAIIGQMAGLADGLRHIHNLGPANLQPDGIQEHAQPVHRSHSQAGYHHDLKPGNILVTTNRDTGDLLFSISDFGSAKMGQILSGSERPSQFTRNPYPGDPVYGAPDTILEGKSSRPYDIWSMGCIVLELLTWINGIEGNSVQTFQDARLETIANAYGDQDTAFWYQDAASRSVSLKPAVVEQLKILKKHCEGRGVFPELIHWTGRMLNVRPGRRPDASQVSNAFKAIMLQLQQDLKSESFYLSDLPTQATIAAPPTPTGSQGGLSRTPSIDERPVSSRYSGNLSPDPKASRRQERLNAGSVNGGAGVRRADAHVRHNSAPISMGRPSQIRTDVDTRMPLPTPPDTELTDEPEVAPSSPRISVSDYDDDDPERREAILH